ncbi:MAG TPA: hypothetical protein VJ787_05930 [Thermoleophilia bacterium]|nr:hypothetical protein [Thermoleophilia bacterium]
MSVLTELAGSSVRLELVLCIEGVGWPEDEHTLSTGFGGVIFSTTDLDGDMAAQLAGTYTPTVYQGLALPSGISSSFDARTNKYARASLTFEIVDVAGWWLTNYTQHRLGGTGEVTLSTAAEFGDTTLRVNDPSNETAVGEVWWIDEREAVRITSRVPVAGSVYDLGVVRGYLGSLRARRGPGLVANGLAWPSTTPLYNRATQWHHRRVALFCKVPGEAAGTCVRLYHGRLSAVTVARQGTLWALATSADLTGRMRRVRETDVTLNAVHVEFTTLSGHTYRQAWAGTEAPLIEELLVADVSTERINRTIDVYPRNGLQGACEIFYAYNYRNRIGGGTTGAKSTGLASPASPQTTTDSQGRKQLGGLINISGNYLRALWMSQAAAPARLNRIVIEGVNLSLGQAPQEKLSGAMYFLLDNYLDDKQLSRFAINNTVRRNPIDVLLMFLTSCNGEFMLRGAQAGSTATVVQLSMGGTANQWAGYALHCTFGTNLGESRVIASNTTTAVTVDRAFTATPNVADQYQIRNTIYDVLPAGWGMEVMNVDIDLASFEDLRNTWLGDEQLGRFAVGDVASLDLWALLYENICRPYDIAVYYDRLTGKLTARYLQVRALQDGLMSSYVQLGTADIISVGDIESALQPIYNKIVIRTRASTVPSVRPLSYVRDPWHPENEGWVYSDEQVVGPGIESAEQEIIVQDADMIGAADGVQAEQLTVDAKLHSINDVTTVIARQIAKLPDIGIPRPRVTIETHWTLFAQVNAGDMVSITDTTLFNPFNPFYNARGWPAVVARVLGTRLSFGPNARLSIDVELLPSIHGARVAPAADVTAKGSDGNGEYFVVHAPSAMSSYRIDPWDDDWALFAVNDRIELRDATGALKEGPEIITGFGTNFVSDPALANSGRVYIAGTITASIVAGDYITFSPWDGSVTANMSNYAAMALSSLLDPGGADDDPKEYHQ